MSCCGNKRNTYRGLSPQEISNALPVSFEQHTQAVEVSFEYRGEKRLTVQGVGTGRRYIFEGKGARQTVAPGDVAGLMGIPGLYRVAQQGIFEK